MKYMRDWERRVLLALLWPIFWLQGKHVRRVTPHMPEASGSRTGVCGQGPDSMSAFSRIRCCQTKNVREGQDCCTKEQYMDIDRFFTAIDRYRDLGSADGGFQAVSLIAAPGRVLRLRIQIGQPQS
jgi:hypothetical protein